VEIMAIPGTGLYASAIFVACCKQVNTADSESGTLTDGPDPNRE
jgi:hypothetical protein